MHQNMQTMTSTNNGVTWTARASSDDSNTWQAVSYGNGTFVAVSNSGTIRVRGGGVHSAFT